MSTNDTEELPLLPTQQKQTLTDTVDNASNDFVSVDNEDEPLTISNQNYSMLTGLCFALNYSIGSGILGLPYEFWKSGYILASIMLIIVGFLQYVAYIYCVDGVIRAEAVTTVANTYGIKPYQIISTPKYVKETLMSNNITAQAIQSSFIIDKNAYQLNESIGNFYVSYIYEFMK